MHVCTHLFHVGQACFLFGRFLLSEPTKQRKVIAQNKNIIFLFIVDWPTYIPVFMSDERCFLEVHGCYVYERPKNLTCVRVFFLQVKKYDSKAAVVGTPKAYSTGEDMVAVKTVGDARPPAILGCIFSVLSKLEVVCAGCVCLLSFSKTFLTLDVDKVIYDWMILAAFFVVSRSPVRMSVYLLASTTKTKTCFAFFFFADNDGFTGRLYYQLKSVALTVSNAVPTF